MPPTPSKYSGHSEGSVVAFVLPLVLLALVTRGFFEGPEVPSSCSIALLARFRVCPFS